MQYTLDGYDFAIHDGAFAEWDKRILQETHEHYNFVDYSTVQAVIDIGAHIGGFSVYVKQKNPRSQVIAIEVNTENARLLEQNAAPLGIQTYHARLGYAAGDFVQWQHPTISGTNSVHNANQSVPEQAIIEPVTCPSLTLEQLRKVHAMPLVDVLKIDCEGGEYDILPNANLTGIRHIVGEYHDGIERFEQAVLSKLTGFETRHIDSTGEWGLFWLTSIS